MITALVLRSFTGRGSSLIFHTLSEEFGRAAMIITPQRGQSFFDFCYIEAEVVRQTEEFVFCREAYVTDPLEELRGAGPTARAAFFLRSIVDRCLPARAPIGDKWPLLRSLFEELHTFADWRAAPFLLACTFFEDSGVSYQELLEAPNLSEESRAFALSLAHADIEFWKKNQIPDELFAAALERVGMKYAKGGT